MLEIENREDWLKIVHLKVFWEVPSKKNSKQIFFNKKTKKRFITSSKSFKIWNKRMKSELTILRKKTGYDLTQENVLVIKLDIYFWSRRKKDLSNVTESIMDLLVDEKFIIDDNAFEVPRLEIQFKWVCRMPRVHIKIVSQKKWLFMEKQFLLDLW